MQDTLGQEKTPDRRRRRRDNDGDCGTLSEHSALKGVKLKFHMPTAPEHAQRVFTAVVVDAATSHNILPRLRPSLRGTHRGVSAAITPPAKTAGGSRMRPTLPHRATRSMFANVWVTVRAMPSLTRKRCVIFLTHSARTGPSSCYSQGVFVDGRLV